MSEYKALKGIKIKTFATDLSGESAEGQVFFSTAAPQRELKTVVASAAWSSAGAMITATGFGTHSGPNSNSFYVGGLPVINTTQHYNGTGWSLGGNYPSSRYGLASAGTQTAGLAMGGEDGNDAKTNVSAAYDGSSWTAGPNINSARGQTGGTGTQTSALLAGGRGPGGAAMVTSFEEWNGTAWVNLTGLTQARGHHGISGPETAAFIAGGGTGNNAGSPVTALTEEFDGSSLSNGGSLNTARTQLGTSGNSGDGLLFAGSSNEKNTEQYNGTSWTETSDLTATHRACGNGAGSISNSKGALAAGAYPAVATTEEWNITVNTITGAAWAAGGNMNTARNLAAGAGTQNAAWIAGGNNPGTTYGVIHEQYNGTAWTEAADLNTPRNRLRGAGSQAAALAFGGFDPGGSSNASEEWNGSSWAEGNNLNTGRRTPGNFGTQTAAVACGGTNPGASPTAHVGTEEYNGTSWSNTNALNAVSPGGSGSGTQTAGLNAMNPGGVSEDYDGSSWATGPSMMIARNAGGSSIEGTQTATQFFAGSPSPTASEQFNGTTFISDASLANGRSSNCGGGTSALSLCFGDNANAEEYTPETTALNLKTLTDS